MKPFRSVSYYTHVHGILFSGTFIGHVLISGFYLCYTELEDHRIGPLEIFNLCMNILRKLEQ